MIQRGQVFRTQLEARRQPGTLGVPLPDGRTHLEANPARRVRDRGRCAAGAGARARRLRRGQGRARLLTLAELVEQYLAQHEASPVTLEKLHWC